MAHRRTESEYFIIFLVPQQPVSQTDESSVPVIYNNRVKKNSQIHSNKPNVPFIELCSIFLCPFISNQSTTETHLLIFTADSLSSLVLCIVTVRTATCSGPFWSWLITIVFYNVYCCVYRVDGTDRTSQSTCYIFFCFVFCHWPKEYYVSTFFSCRLQFSTLSLAYIF